MPLWISKFNLCDFQGFKLIPGFKRYIINNSGTVVSLITGHKKTTWVNTHGYLSVGLQTDVGKTVVKNIHILVASAWIGLRPPGYCVCHNDGNKLNNNFENLRYDTYRNNVLDKIKHGTHRFGEKINTSKLTQYQVAEIRRDYVRIHRTKSNSRALAKKYGVTKETIANIVSGRSWFDANKELDDILGK